jgi:hypothetical protein
LTPPQSLALLYGKIWLTSAASATDAGFAPDAPASPHHLHPAPPAVIFLRQVRENNNITSSRDKAPMKNHNGYS